MKNFTPMGTKNYQELLQAYYDGSSTSAEEKELLDMVKDGRLHELAFIDEQVISALHELGLNTQEEPAELESEVLARLDQLQTPRIRHFNPVLYWVGSAAAIGLVLISSLLFLNRGADLGSYKDPQLAYNEVQTTLAKVSGYLGQGTGQLRLMGKLGDSMKPLENLDQFEKANRNLSLLGKLNPGWQISEEITTEK